MLGMLELLGYPKERVIFGFANCDTNTPLNPALGRLPHGRIGVRIESRQAIYVRWWRMRNR